MLHIENYSKSKSFYNHELHLFFNKWIQDGCKYIITNQALDY